MGSRVLVFGDCVAFGDWRWWLLLIDGVASLHGESSLACPVVACLDVDTAGVANVVVTEYIVTATAIATAMGIPKDILSTFPGSCSQGMQGVESSWWCIHCCLMSDNDESTGTWFQRLVSLPVEIDC
jgi:hypothetical protein